MTDVPVHDGLFACDAGGRPYLLIGRCQACGRHHFPVAPTCPYCGSSEISEHHSDTGTLWGWTAVTAPPPGYRGPVPFGFGVVELSDVDLRVITLLAEADPGRLHFGMPMKLSLTRVSSAADNGDDGDSNGDGVITYTFGPA
jgi:uncharacterized OB-fold protein